MHLQIRPTNERGNEKKSVRRCLFVWLIGVSVQDKVYAISDNQTMATSTDKPLIGIVLYSSRSRAHTSEESEIVRGRRKDSGTKRKIRKR